MNNPSTLHISLMENSVSPLFAASRCRWTGAGCRHWNLEETLLCAALCDFSAMLFRIVLWLQYDVLLLPLTQHWSTLKKSTMDGAVGRVSLFVICHFIIVFVLTTMRPIILQFTVSENHNFHNRRQNTCVWQILQIKLYVWDLLYIHNFKALSPDTSTWIYFVSIQLFFKLQIKYLNKPLYQVSKHMLNVAYRSSTARSMWICVPPTLMPPFTPMSTNAPHATRLMREEMITRQVT